MALGVSREGPWVEVGGPGGVEGTFVDIHIFDEGEGLQVGV